jgi:hypothetical protein
LSINMRLGLFVALPLVASLHFVKCVVDKWSEDLNSQAQAAHAQP